MSEARKQFYCMWDEDDAGNAVWDYVKELEETLALAQKELKNCDDLHIDDAMRSMKIVLEAIEEVINE